MKIASTVFALVALAAAPAVAHAGGYVSAGVGTAPSIGGELDFLQARGDRSARLGLGHAMGPVALEASLGGYGVHGGAPEGDFVDGTAIALGASVRGRLPVIATLGVFGRIGLERTWVAGDMNDLSGQGYLLGGGLDLGLPMILSNAALWIEADREFVTLSRSAGSYDGWVDTVTLGLRFGL